MQSILQDTNLGTLMGNAYGKKIFQMASKILFCPGWVPDCSHTDREKESVEEPVRGRLDMVVAVQGPDPSLVQPGQAVCRSPHSVCLS